MRFRVALLESSIFFIIGACLMAISLASIELGLLNFIHPSGFWEQRTGVITALLIGYGILFITIAIYRLFNSSKGQTLSDELALSLKTIPNKLKVLIKSIGEINKMIGKDFLWIVISLAIGAIARAYFLSQPMRGDEAYTFLNFANKGIRAIFDYPVPNNHVFHTILIKLSTSIWGASPVSIRLPAFFAGIGSILLVYYLSQTLNRAKYSGNLAALVTATFPYLILYSTNARGYTLVVFITLVLTFFGMLTSKNPSLLNVTMFSALSSLGLFTMPSMILGSSGIFCWVLGLLFLNKFRARTILINFVLPFTVLSLVFTFILYTPVIFMANGIKPIIANKFVESRSWPFFFANILPQIQMTLYEIFRDIPSYLLLIGLSLIILGLYFAYKQRHWSIFLLLPSVFFGAMAVILFQHSLPYARTWIYTLPFIFIIADYGFISLLNRFSPYTRSIANIFLFAVGLYFSFHLMSANTISNYPDTSAFPEAPLVAEYLKPILNDNDIVHITSTADWSVYFYFWYYDLPQPASNNSTNNGRTFIILKKSRASLQDLTDKKVIKLLDVRDMALYQEVDK